VIRAEHTYSYEDPRGKKRRVDRIDDLAGEVVVSERFRKTWRHTLLEVEPSPYGRRPSCIVGQTGIIADEA
jgi:hypothetical protein